MNFGDDRSLYDVLELTPDASPQEIRSAYLRSKSAYKKDSVALYTLISESETEELLGKIEEAYQILSNPEKRRDYDRKHGSLIAEETSLDPFELNPKPQKPANVVSIDRVPPMEDLRSGDDILVPPSTDFGSASASPASAKSSGSMFEKQEPKTEIHPKMGPETDSSAEPKTGAAFAVEEATKLINAEEEWRGPFLRKVRELRNVPIEELADYTKISKTYLFAIEEENFARLPAAVFVRGFLTQVSKYLKLPHEKVTVAYLKRLSLWQSEKDNAKISRGR